MKNASIESGVADVAPARRNSATLSQDFEQPRYSRRETILTMIGVLLVMLLASLDQTSPLL
jgi:hypothetical protein